MTEEPKTEEGTETEEDTQTKDGTKLEKGTETEEDTKTEEKEHLTTVSEKEQRTIYVGSLSQEITEDDLKGYFQNYGELESVDLVTNSRRPSRKGRAKNGSRGFGFIVFKEVESAQKALGDGEHQLKSQPLVVKKIEARNPRRIYIGKLPDTGCEVDKIEEHFKQFGTVIDVLRPFNKKTRKRELKNYCFVTFEHESVAKKLRAEGKCVINGNTLIIKQNAPNLHDQETKRQLNKGRGEERVGLKKGRFSDNEWMNNRNGGGFGDFRGGGYGGYQGFENGFAGGMGGSRMGGEGFCSRMDGNGFGGGSFGGEMVDDFGGGDGYGGDYGGEGGFRAGCGGGVVGGGFVGGRGGGCWSNGGGKMMGGRGRWGDKRDRPY